MKICAITMVYRDYWALSQWYAHYGRHLGEDNLFIVAHGSDPMVQTLCPKASVITVPRENLAGFDRVRSDMLNALQNALGHAYDWVIRTDADELICLDPGLYGSFQDMFSMQHARALFALGLNIVEMKGDLPLDEAEPALSKRSNAVFSGHYSKAWAVRDKIALERHGIRVRPAKASGFDYVMVPGVYLAHLKYANRAALLPVNADRMSVALGTEHGLPGNAWRDAENRADSYLQLVAGLPLVEWDAGLAKANEKLQTPVRNSKDGLIRSRSLRFKFRTALPAWFKKC